MLSVDELPPPEISTFWRLCDDTGICHCDFRYTIYNCAETDIAKWFYIASAIVSSLLAIINFILLYFRLNYKNQHIFIIKNGFFRPKPIESMGLFGLIFNILQMLQSVFIVTKSIPNPVFRSFFHDFVYQFGFGCLVCYLFGVGYTLSDTSHVMYSSWVKSDKRVNILFTITILLPPITNTTWSILAGYYAGAGNISMAKMFTTIQYYFWMLYCLYLGTLLLSAGIRLLRLLSHHLLAQSDYKANVNRFKLGALRVKLILVAGSSVLYIFAFLLILYNVCREAILTNRVSNLVVAAVWLFIGPVTVFVVEMAIMINPAIAKQLSYLSFGISSSHNHSSEDRYNGIGLDSNILKQENINLPKTEQIV